MFGQLLRAPDPASFNEPGMSRHEPRTPITELERICSQAVILGAQQLNPALRSQVVPSEHTFEGLIGKRAVTTQADIDSQNAILKAIANAEVGSLLVAEERSLIPAGLELLTATTAPLLLRDRLCWLVDGLDGTTSFRRELPDYSVAAAGFRYRDGQGLQGEIAAIIAPSIVGRPLWSAARGYGAVITTHRSDKSIKRPINASTLQELERAIVAVGVDCTIADKFPRQFKLVESLGSHISQTRIFGSSSFALGYLAQGSVDLMISPVQSPWDFAPGLFIAEQAGAKVCLYEHTAEGAIQEVRLLTPKHFDPAKRQIGYIAGSAPLVDVAFEMLVRGSAAC